MAVQHQIATVYNHENPEILGMSMAGEYAMSSLVDNILLLNWTALLLAAVGAVIGRRR